MDNPRELFAISCVFISCSFMIIAEISNLTLTRIQRKLEKKVGGFFLLQK